MSAKILSSPIILVIALVYVIFGGCRLIWSLPYTLKQSTLTIRQRSRLRKLYNQQPGTTKLPQYLGVTLCLLIILSLVIPLSGWSVPQLWLSFIWLIWLLIGWWSGRQGLDRRRNYWQAQHGQLPFNLIDDKQFQTRRIQFNRLVIAAIIAILDYGWLFH
ncbi:hypothetical protein ACFQH1_04745 [Lactiplantibacillus daoliensis]|uniref:Integral membrane protein n=1 Tax=Lactiplantibacillus daoliensis TaxID=2559916 RepID=A0ABW1UEF2_9LACO|nr:hypothetical protein [Lactiplantibacillus daoliensis]